MELVRSCLGFSVLEILNCVGAGRSPVMTSSRVQYVRSSRLPNLGRVYSLSAVITTSDTSSQSCGPSFGFESKALTAARTCFIAFSTVPFIQGEYVTVNMCLIR